MVKLIFQKDQKIYTTRSGFELVTLKQIYPDIPLRFGCRQGHCGTCLIKILDGCENLSKPTKTERQTLEAKQLCSVIYRLACQCAILDNVIIE